MKLFLVTLLAGITTVVYSQDLLSQLNDNAPKEKEIVTQTFKGTRVVNGYSVETLAKGDLEFIISHRFGRLNSGGSELFGLDFATIRLGLEYGVTDKLGIALGRSQHNKIYDGFIKYKLVSQSKGGGSPVTVTLVGGAGLLTKDTTFSSPALTTNQKLYYSAHALIARKFSPSFSMQISPVILHSNLVAAGEANNLAALGVGGRYKITRSLALNAEYFHRLNAPKGIYENAIGIGFDIETGGHVFQLIFSNTHGMVDRTFLGNTEGDFFKGDINFGFNITRNFTLKKQK